MTDDRVLLTLLSSMAGAEVEASFDRHVAWNVRTLDLKDALYGKTVEQLTGAEAAALLEAARRRGLSVNTLSSGLFFGDVEQGEAAFREAYLPRLANLLEVARVLQPTQVRLLMATSSRRAEILDSTAYLTARHPWLFDVYREAVDRIHEAGFATVIENEVRGCLFASPEEIAGFFSVLDRGDAVSLTWDVQNLWQMGTFPSPVVYRALKPYLGMLHLKGGRSEIPGGELKWRSSLEEASWPVLPIVREVVADGASPVLCLNPSHGAQTPGYTPDYQRDLEFLRREIEEIE